MNGTALRPATTAELSEMVKASKSLYVYGSGSKTAWRGANEGTPISTAGLTGITEFTAADQVVVVRAGTLISELNRELAPRNQCIPLVDTDAIGTIGGALSMNLPHRLEAECGSWRDWVLGMTVVQADGTIAKAGSRAVKSVAGYDVHKFLVGTRGTMAVVAEVILRTYPLKSLPLPKLNTYGSFDEAGAYQRVLATDFSKAVAANSGDGFDIVNTQTLFRTKPYLQRFPGDWILIAGQPIAADRFSRRAKDLFDPAGKFNKRELAF